MSEISWNDHLSKTTNKMSTGLSSAEIAMIGIWFSLFLSSGRVLQLCTRLSKYDFYDNIKGFEV